MSPDTEVSNVPSMRGGLDISARLVTPLVPPTVVCAELSPLVDGLLVHPLEAALVSLASARRRREFTVGRWLANSTLKRLGRGDSPVLAGHDRSPIWPEGIVGSISHTDDYCVAVTALSRHHISVGVDIEPMEPIESSLWDSICTEGELRWLRRQHALKQGLLCRLIFSAKECIYKYQYPMTNTFLDFHDVEVRFNLPEESFQGFYVRPDETLLHGTVLIGRYRISAYFVFSSSSHSLCSSGLCFFPRAFNRTAFYRSLNNRGTVLVSLTFSPRSEISPMRNGVIVLNFDEGGWVIHAPVPT